MWLARKREIKKYPEIVGWRDREIFLRLEKPVHVERQTGRKQRRGRS